MLGVNLQGPRALLIFQNPNAIPEPDGLPREDDHVY